MESQMRDEDIFYSDEEFSDSEDFYQVGPCTKLEHVSIVNAVLF